MFSRLKDIVGHFGQDSFSPFGFRQRGMAPFLPTLNLFLGKKSEKTALQCYAVLATLATLYNAKYKIFSPLD
jgi:hypothetical protein